MSRILREVAFKGIIQRDSSNIDHTKQNCSFHDGVRTEAVPGTIVKGLWGEVQRARRPSTGEESLPKGFYIYPGARQERFSPKTSRPLLFPQAPITHLIEPRHRIALRTFVKVINAWGFRSLS